MNSTIKKSFNKLSQNPSIMLLLVTYFLITASLMPTLLFQYGRPAFYIICGLLLLLTGAFLAGWFGMIKSIVLFEETEDPQKNYIERLKAIKNGFFGSIPLYIFPVIFFIILFALVTKGLLSAADYIFGDPSELLNQIAMFANDKDALVNFLSTLPDGTLAMVTKRSVFLYFGFLFYLLLTFYAIPSMYFKNCPNPLLALKNGVVALFKKPLFTALFFFSIVALHIFIIFIEAISTVNQILMFFALILRVCFICYVVVLIFSVYEKNFTNNCNNGADSLGENCSIN